MIRFLTLFLRNFGNLRRVISIRNVRYHALLRKTVPASDLFRRFLVWNWWRPILLLFIKSNFIMVIFTTFLSLSFGIINSLVIGKGYGWIFEYSPISYSNLVDIMSTILVICSGWITVVLVNHFSELSTMFMQFADGNFVAVASFLFIVLWDLPQQFFTVLFSDPKAIFDTLVIKEIVLFIGIIGDAIGWSYSIVANATSGILHDFLVGFGQNISHFWSISINFLGSAIRSGFTNLVDLVFGFINPNSTGPFSSITNPVFKGLATTISIGLILWILRFLGFPL